MSKYFIYPAKREGGFCLYVGIWNPKALRKLKGKVKLFNPLKLEKAASVEEYIEITNALCVAYTGYPVFEGCEVEMAYCSTTYWEENPEDIYYIQNFKLSVLDRIRGFGRTILRRLNVYGN